MARKKECKSNKEGRIFIVKPTIDMMLSTCINVKLVANLGGFEYSNFVKTCKLGKDIRLSSLERCATAFGRDTLVIHLPAGLVESVTNPQVHHSGLFHTIEEAELKIVLREILKIKKSQFLPYLELFFSVLEESNDCTEDLLQRLIRVLQNTIDENGK